MTQVTQVAQEDTRKNKKMIVGIMALVFAVVMIIGAGFAYFSDIIEGNGSATAGTLDIVGDISLEQNGVAVENNLVTNFNPGDILTFDTSNIENEGSKSAWIRLALQFSAISDTNYGSSCSNPQYTTQATCEGASETWTTSTVGNLADYLYVCTGTHTKASLIAASLSTANGGGFANNLPTGCSPANTTSTFGKSTGFALSADVINGTAEVEDGTANADQTWAPAAADAITIYFDAAAGNVAQLGTATFRALIQALQYRNNETASSIDWSFVTATEFSL